MNGKQIQEVTVRGLTYLTETGHEEFIDFSKCLENYLSIAYSPENLRRIQEFNHLNNEQLEDYRRSKYWSTIVGERNIIELYITFYTDTPTRFDFDSKEEFQKVRKAIEKYGWTTGDRT